MGLVTKTNTFSSGQVVQASHHNTNFDTLYTLVNGNIENENIKSSAAIAESKLTFATSGHNHTGSTNGAFIPLTGLSSASANSGDIIYFNGTAWARLGTGANATTLTMSSGLPTWL